MLRLVLGEVRRLCKGNEMCIREKCPKRYNTDAYSCDIIWNAEHANFV